jgi:sporulation protein YlmC with PRC-barrel domain
MKKFVSELKGKTAMTKDGQILGIIDNFVVDSASGDIMHVLIVPSQEIETRLFNLDAQGRIILPFPSMNSVRDVVVMNIS